MIGTVGDALRGVPHATDDPVTEAILSALVSAGDGGARRAELDEAAGASPATVRRRLDTLTALGAITRTGTGRGTRYHLADHDQAAERARGDEDQADAGDRDQDDEAGTARSDAVPTAPRTRPPRDERDDRQDDDVPPVAEVPAPRAEDADRPARRRSGPRVILPRQPDAPADDDRDQDERRAVVPRRTEGSSPAVRGRSAARVLPPPRPGELDIPDPRRPGGRGRRRELLPAGFFNAKGGRDPRERARTLAVLAGLVVGLVVVDGAVVLLYRATGTAVTITVGLAVLGGVAAWLRRRRDRVLTIAVVYVQVVLGIAVAVGVWVYLHPGWAGLTYQEHTWDCSSGLSATTCIADTGDTKSSVLFAAAAAVFLFGATAPPAWYWFGERPSRPRGRRALAVSLALVVLAAGGVAWTFWDGTNRFGTVNKASPDEILFDYMDDLTSKAPDELDPKNPSKFPPSMEATTCHDAAFRRKILSWAWSYRKWDDKHDSFVYMHAWTDKTTVHGDRATVVAHIGYQEGTYDPADAPWTFHLVRERGLLGDSGWRVCGIDVPDQN